VGYTLRSAQERLNELNGSTSIPRKFKLEYFVEVHDDVAHEIEQSAHAELERQNFHHGKEYFECALNYCKEAIIKEIANRNITVYKAEDAMCDSAPHCRNEKAS
jgi:hypothetical protein